MNKTNIFLYSIAVIVYLVGIYLPWFFPLTSLLLLFLLGMDSRSFVVKKINSTGRKLSDGKLFLMGVLFVVIFYILSTLLLMLVGKWLY